MGYIGMCGPKGHGFSVVLVIKRASILAISRDGFCARLEMGLCVCVFFLREATFLSLSIRSSTKGLHNALV